MTGPCGQPPTMDAMQPLTVVTPDFGAERTRLWLVDKWEDRGRHLSKW